MKKTNISTAILTILLFTEAVFALAQENFGDKPAIPNSDWPAGTITAVEAPGKVYSVWVNGDERFYFRGDTKSFNSFLKTFAAIEMPAHRLILEKRFNQVRSLGGGMSLRYDWFLSVPSGIYRRQLVSDKGNDSNEIYPTLYVSMHSNSINIDDLNLPSNVDFLLPDGQSADILKLKVSETAAAWPETQKSTIDKNKPELCDEAKYILDEFHSALNTNRKLKALLLCSKRVQAMAAEYDSADDFFDDVVPLKEITADYPQQVRGWEKRGDKVVRYSFETRLTIPEEQGNFHWPWSVVRKKQGWVIDFEPKPLKIWKKHAVLERKVMNPEAVNDLWRQDPDKLKQGLVIDLIPQSKEFVVGRPMLFDISIKNVSDETLMYTKTSWMVNDPMRVTAPDGNDVPYIDTSYQTIIRPEFIEPGQTIKLVDDYDVRSQYHIIKPGRYTFRFKGFYPEILSNTVELEVKNGRLSNLEIITEKLLKVLPDAWILTRSQRPHIEDDIESDTPYIAVHMIGERGKKGKSRGIELIMFINLSSNDKVAKEWIEQGFKYWGQSDFGSVYVSAFNAEKLWPDYKKQILAALGVEEP